MFFFADCSPGLVRAMLYTNHPVEVMTTSSDLMFWSLWGYYIYGFF